MKGEDMLQAIYMDAHNLANGITSINKIALARKDEIEDNYLHMYLNMVAARASTIKKDAWALDAYKHQGGYNIRDKEE